VPHVRFDERRQETGPCQPGLRACAKATPPTHRATHVTAPVVDSTDFARDDAPEWARQCAALWNAAEGFEKRKDAQLAFEWEGALPASLTDERRADIVRDFTGWLVEEYGVAGTAGIHSGGGRGNGLNDHVHVMMTTRPVDADGFGAKLRQFSVRPGAKNPEVDKVKEKFAECINDALEEAGSDERVDHRSFKARGLDREGTKHLGPAATAYERQGFETRRGDVNREIREENRAREIIEERLRWQLEEAQPEITADLAHEFADRWGDLAPEPPPVAAERLPQQGEPLPADRLADAPPFAAEPGEAKRVTPWGYAWRAFTDRARSFASSLRDVWEDERSGTPTPEPDQPPERAPDKRPSWLERMRARAADILGNQRGAAPDLAGPDDIVWSDTLPEGSPDDAADIPPEPDDYPGPGDGIDYGPEPDEGPDFG
jgi:hypothetical protein